MSFGITIDLFCRIKLIHLKVINDISGYLSIANRVISGADILDE